MYALHLSGIHVRRTCISVNTALLFTCGLHHDLEKIWQPWILHCDREFRDVYILVVVVFLVVMNMDCKSVISEHSVLYPLFSTLPQSFWD